MNKKQVKELLNNPVAHAFADGRTIECYDDRVNAWVDISDFLNLTNLDKYPDRYRIKPLERWLVITLTKAEYLYPDEGTARQKMALHGGTVYRLVEQV